MAECHGGVKSNSAFSLYLLIVLSFDTNFSHCNQYSGFLYLNPLVLKVLY